MFLKHLTQNGVSNLEKTFDSSLKKSTTAFRWNWE